MNETQGLELSNVGNSGILGLSFPFAAAISPTTGRTLLENIFACLDDYHRFFAFKLNRDHSLDQGPGISTTYNPSSFTVGELDPAIANDTSHFSFTPVVSAGQSTYDFWKLPLRNITVNSHPITISPSLIPRSATPIAVLDTGTTLILGPTIDIIAFWAAVGSNETVRKNASSGLWEVKCNRALNVGLSLGDETTSKEYAIHPWDINIGEGRTSDGWCMGGVQANDNVSNWFV